METFLRAGLGNALLATVLALGAACAGCLLRHRPAVRHALWLLVLLKLIIPPLWVVPLVRLEPESTGGLELAPSVVVEMDLDAGFERAGINAVRDDRASENRWGWSLPRWALGPAVRGRLAIAWLTGSLLSLAVTGVRIRRWNQLLRFVEPANDDVQDGVDILAQTMGIAHPPRAYWFPGASAPMLWAFGCRARLIVPCKLWDRLDDRQRTTLLVHELAHLRRRDHWVRVVELLATACFWWLPPAWIARWALREAEEQCCDAWVVSTCPDAHRTYAETLLDTVDFLSETGRTVPLAASGFGHAHHLKRRVTMIMQGETPRGLSGTGLLTIFGLAALLLPLSPTWAQKADGEGPAAVDQVGEEKEGRSESSDLESLKRKIREAMLEATSGQDQVRGKESSASRPKQPDEASPDESNDTTAKRQAERRNEFRALLMEYQRARRKAESEAERAKSLFEKVKNEAKGSRDKAEKALDEVEKAEGERERISPRVREFKYFEKDALEGRLKDAQAAAEGEVIGKEMARAKLEVERARAQLRQAELQLAKLGAELKAKRSDAARRSNKRKVEDDPSTKPTEKPESRPRDSKFENRKVPDQLKASDLDLKLKASLMDLIGQVELAEPGRHLPKIDAEQLHRSADLRAKKLRSSTPDINWHISELEVLREKYAETVREYKRRFPNFDYDPAFRFTTEKLEKVRKRLEQLKSLNEASRPKEDA